METNPVTHHLLFTSFPTFKLMDYTINVRIGNELDKDALQAFLQQEIPEFKTITDIRQFSGGYSNLTYLIRTEDRDYVLRKPPHGAKIKSAHDMSREYKILSALWGQFNKIPQPLTFSEEASIIGTPFYVMEKVNGIVLRMETLEILNPSAEQFRKLSYAAVHQLAELHAIDIEETGLMNFGKPEGYVTRQVEGWTKRYYRAATDDIPTMDAMAQWMPDHLPAEQTPTLIHNDFKYDNFILNEEDLSQIKAILDWEMATIGDPLMDLGTSLAYWIEEKDADIMKMFNTTWRQGNMTRKEVIDEYGSLTGRNMDEMPFYYVYGLFKVAVICQQIYARHVKGLTNDPRFGGLIYVVKAAAQRGYDVIQTGKI